MYIKFIIISAISSFLSGVGLGGGSLFIMIGMFFLKLSQRNLQGLNLILFISSGIGATFYNFKNNKINKELSKKIIPMLIIGCIFGTYISFKINQKKLRKYFLIFIVIIGIYEIISSVINLKKTKNNNEK